ncbi:uncharacterized protein B0H18DRAFT_248867 [Fomitopsis serialis]|uniref:uncharacterized protein n=1 Tax=Fomitopsis serialis TaxID=139415 RepID=UPI002007A758|nr:uncharacterized protein B0H18DRAFT_248867 [Neoantrodia serialis]KAH9912520.1 hypothetical protein B0H18DRAFT_248867 [Neoantrodia serialis]
MLTRYLRRYIMCSPFIQALLWSLLPPCLARDHMGVYGCCGDSAQPLITVFHTQSAEFECPWTEKLCGQKVDTAWYRYTRSLTVPSIRCSTILSRTAP